MPRLSRLDLDGLRRCILPDFARMPDDELEQIVESSLSDVPHTAAEDFMKSLRALSKSVSPGLQRAVPGIAKGAATGASLGGPWGALIGAGVASSSLGRAPRTRSVAASGRPASSAKGPAATPQAAPLPTGSAAAATLIGLLQDPTVQRALMSQVLGVSGAPQIATTLGTSLPRGAINGLLTQLLANASEGLAEAESVSDQAYLQDAHGEYVVDPASPEQQAALVLSHLQSARAPALRRERVDVLPAAESEWMAETPAGSESATWLESEGGGEAVRFY